MTLLVVKVFGYALVQGILAYLGFHYTTKSMRSKPHRDRARVWFVALTVTAVALFGLSEYLSQRASDAGVAATTERLTAMQSQQQNTLAALQQLQSQNDYMRIRLDYALKRPVGKPVSDKQLAVDAVAVARGIRALYAEYQSKENALNGQRMDVSPSAPPDERRKNWVRGNEADMELDNTYRLRFNNLFAGRAAYVYGEMVKRLPPQPQATPRLGPCSDPLFADSLRPGWPWIAECAPDKLESLAHQLHPAL